jgi:hypothetical protein
MARTKFGKSRTIEKPYAIYRGFGPFGETEVRVLKTYQSAEKEKGNPYARWFVAVKSDFTYGNFDMGDSYIKEAIYGLRLVECEEAWKTEYQEVKQ